MKAERLNALFDCNLFMLIQVVEIYSSCREKGEIEKNYKTESKQYKQLCTCIYILKK